MYSPFRLALLLNLCAMSVAAAQPASKRPDDFSAIGAGRTVTVIDDAGQKTTGRLLRFTPESLAIAVGRGEATFERKTVSTVWEDGDSLRNGMKFGAIAGGGFGLFVGISLAGWASCDYNGCNVGEGAAVAVVPTFIFGLAGLGAGAAIDALHSGQRQLYERTPEARIKGGPQDFSGLAAEREVIVIDDLDRSTRGELLGVTPEAVELRVGTLRRTFSRHEVKTVFERGDSVKNGVAIGLVTGIAAGFATGVSKTSCGRDPLGIGIIIVFSRYEPCAASERVGQGLKNAALLGLLGMGLGATIDALIPGRHVLYERPQRRPVTNISIVPSLGPSRSGLSMAVSW